MKNYLKRPEALLLSVYIVCFAHGLISPLLGFDTFTLLDKLPDLCIFKRLTGYKDPGCGMTHAFLSLGRFQFRQALRYNIFSVFLFYGGLLRLVYPGPIRFRIGNKMTGFLAALVIAYWICRNLDMIS